MTCCGYPMIEEPRRAFGFPATIEDRSACVTSHRGVGTSRKLFSMRRKPVWGGPPVLTCCCVRPMSSGPTIARA